jgi:syntaxin 1B/2/3
LIQQVADLVAEQDPQIVRIEQTAEGVQGDIENGLRGVQKAKLSAGAARHKRKICAAIGLIMVVIVIVVIVVQFKGSGRGGGGGAGEGQKAEEKKPIEIAPVGLM